MLNSMPCTKAGAFDNLDSSTSISSCPVGVRVEGLRLPKQGLVMSSKMPLAWPLLEVLQLLQGQLGNDKKPLDKVFLECICI